LDILNKAVQIRITKAGAFGLKIAKSASAHLPFELKNANTTNNLLALFGSNKRKEW
jgi:hypothetical protein